MPADWNTLSFDDNIWNEGPGGFGYSDGDDGTSANTAVGIGQGLGNRFVNQRPFGGVPLGS